MAMTKTGKLVDIPERWRKKFREWGSMGGKAGTREAKSRAGRAAWAPGGGNYHKRKKTPATTAQDQPQPADVESALNAIKNA